MENDVLGIGIDSEIDAAAEETAEKKVVSMDEAKKKRAPWHEWQVGGQSYRLKLTTQNILKVEKKYRTNIMNLLSSDGIPPLSVMLTIVQAAMLPFHHGIKSNEVEKIYDLYVDAGGGQTGLMNDVITPTMMVSGFFTESQEAAMGAQMGMDDLI